MARSGDLTGLVRSDRKRDRGYTGHSLNVRRITNRRVRSVHTDCDCGSLDETGRVGPKGNKMKNSKTCPKCQAGDIIRIPGDARAFGAGNNIIVGATIFSAAKVTRFLCGSCGFSEEWVESRDDIAAIRKKYVS